MSLDLRALAEEADESPKSFLEDHPPPVLIDEVQYAPGLFRPLKVATDANTPPAGRLPSRILGGSLGPLTDDWSGMGGLRLHRDRQMVEPLSPGVDALVLSRPAAARGRLLGPGALARDPRAGREVVRDPAGRCWLRSFPAGRRAIGSANDVISSPASMWVRILSEPMRAGRRRGLLLALAQDLRRLRGEAGEILVGRRVLQTPCLRLRVGGLRLIAYSLRASRSRARAR